MGGGDLLLYLLITLHLKPIFLLLQISFSCSPSLYTCSPLSHSPVHLSLFSVSLSIHLFLSPPVTHFRTPLSFLPFHSLFPSLSSHPLSPPCAYPTSLMKGPGRLCFQRSSVSGQCEPGVPESTKQTSSLLKGEILYHWL